jgi:hypothetical protein
MTDPEMMDRIRSAMEELAALDYPRVWIGEVGMTPDEYLRLEQMNEQERREAWEGMTQQERRELFEKEMPTDLRERLSEEQREEPPKKWENLPEWLRNEMKTPLEVQPGEFVALDDSEEVGVHVPKIGYEYLDGLYVVKNMRHEMDPYVYADLEREVAHIHAAKQGAVLTIRDSKELMDAGIPPDVRSVPLSNLTAEDLPHVRPEEMEFYASDTMGPFVIEDSERARIALKERLGLS